MTRARLALAVAVVVVAGCKAKHAEEIREVVTKFRRFASDMCACKDKACGDKVQAAMTQWSSDLAKNSSAKSDERPDEASIKEMTDLGQKYAECLTKLMSEDGPPLTPPEPTAAPDAPPRPPPNIKLSLAGERPSIGKLIEEAKASTRADEEELVIHVLRARYVASTGELDPKYGELTIGFGNRLYPGAGTIVDDPARPTGAPIPDPIIPPPPKRPDSAMCPHAVWTSTKGWSWDERPCMATSDVVPKCSTAEVWKRAQRTKGIQTNAVAVLELVRNEDATQAWEFSIHDELRKVNITARIPDTCEPIAEKP